MTDNNMMHNETQMVQTAQMVTVTVNSESLRVPTGTSLADLLAQREVAPNAIGTAVNGRHVLRGARAACVLADGDVVTLFQPIVGG